jgi:hypothetical protein
MKRELTFLRVKIDDRVVAKKEAETPWPNIDLRKKPRKRMILFLGKKRSSLGRFGSEGRNRPV